MKRTIAWMRSGQMSSRTARDGGFTTQPGSLGAVTQYTSGAANKFPLPSGSIASPVPALKSLNLTQALLDGLTVVGGLIALMIVFGSLPLAVGLMIFGAF